MKVKYIVAMVVGIMITAIMAEAAGGARQRDRVKDCDPVSPDCICEICPQECDCAQDRTQDQTKDCDQDCEKDGDQAKDRKQARDGSCSAE